MPNSPAVNVPLTAKDGTKRAFDSVQKSLKSLARGARVAGKALKISFAGLAGLTAAYGASLAATTNRLSELGRTAKRTGVDVKSLQVLQRIAEEGFVEVDQLNDGLKTFAEKMGEANNEVGGSANVAFRRLGVSLRDANRVARPVVDVFKDVVDQILSIDSASSRVYFAEQLFSEAGTDILQAFRTGSLGVDEMMAKLEKLGRLHGTEAIEQANQIRKAYVGISSAITTLREKFTLAFGDDVIETLKTLGRVVDQLDFTGIGKGTGEAEKGMNVFDKAVIVVIKSLTVLLEILKRIKDTIVSISTKGWLETMFGGGTDQSKIDQSIVTPASVPHQSSNPILDWLLEHGERKQRLMTPIATHGGGPRDPDISRATKTAQTNPTLWGVELTSEAAQMMLQAALKMEELAEKRDDGDGTGKGGLPAVTVTGSQKWWEKMITQFQTRFMGAWDEISTKLNEALTPTWEAVHSSMTGAVKTGIEQGGKAGADVLKQYLLDSVYKNIAAFLTQSLGGLLAGLGGGGGLGGFLNFIGIPFGGGKAKGGPVMKGMSYLVGERGPEIFTPQASGNITPNHRMGNTINVTVDSPRVNSPAEIDLLATTIADRVRNINLARDAYGVA